MAAGEMVSAPAFRPRVLQLAQQRKEAEAAVAARRQAWVEKKQREGHGTYEKYYHYRKNDEESGLDPRLSLMKEEWFAGKDYLDVGCCSGKVPWQIFQQFKPRSVVGVDIDRDMICVANEKLFYAGVKDGEDYSDRLDFRWEDFVAPSPSPEEGPGRSSSAAPPGGRHEAESYDVISCLSTTKWVHLNGGDAALKRLFTRVHRLLRPGGCFLLEPQPWSSYRKRKRVSEQATRHFEEIQLRPDGFSDFLTSEQGGFAEGQLLGLPSGGEQGYRRPVYRFVKAPLGPGRGGGEQDEGPRGAAAEAPAEKPAKRRKKKEEL